MFDDMQKQIQDHDEETTHNHQLEEIITKSYSELPDLQIQSKVAPEENIEKLSTTFKESNTEMDRINFEFHMHIHEQHLKLQATTL